MKSTQWLMKSKVGPLYLVADEKVLLGIHWTRQSIPMARSLDENPILKRAARQLEEYFSGARTRFDLPTEQKGTEFQKRVWATLKKIPYGKTLSYSDVAKRVGSPRAVRAVGTANGKNRIPILIPCHRVIAASGQLAGYTGGISLKKTLLALEGSGGRSAGLRRKGL